MLAAVVGGVVLLVYLGGSSAPVPSAASGRLRDRLVGTWDADLGERGSATLQFNRDGTLVLTTNAIVNGQRRNVRETGRWEVLREDGERLTVARRTDNLGTASTNEFAFAGNDTFTIAGEGGGLTYHRH